MTTIVEDLQERAQQYANRACLLRWVEEAGSEEEYRLAQDMPYDILYSLYSNPQSYHPAWITTINLWHVIANHDEASGHAVAEALLPLLRKGEELPHTPDNESSACDVFRSASIGRDSYISRSLSESYVGWAVLMRSLYFSLQKIGNGILDQAFELPEIWSNIVQHTVILPLNMGEARQLLPMVDSVVEAARGTTCRLGINCPIG